MNNEIYARYKNLLENAIDNDLLEQDDFDVNDFQTEVCNIEREVAEAIEMNEAMGAGVDVSTSKLKTIVQLIGQIKREYDFYDEDAELDMMFPDRHDDDFDDDSMNYESVFGKD